MYKLIIADDERVICENIMKIMDFQSYGFEVIACCSNGMDVLEKVSQDCPDVIITDIQMPFMDGVELAHELRLQYPIIEIVFLTGYDEFEYAKQAINLHAFDYLLKPISADMLGEALIKIKKHLDDQTLLHQNFLLLSEHYNNNLPILRNSFVFELLTLPIARNKILEKSQNLKLPFLQKEMFKIGVLAIDTEEIESSILEKDREVYGYAVYNITSEILSENQYINVVPYAEKTVLILSSDDKDIEFAQSKFEKSIQHIKDIIDKHMPFTISVGISELFTEIQRISCYYSRALAALEYRITMGTNRIFYIEDLEPVQPQFPVFDYDTETQLLTAIKLGSDKIVENIIDKIIRQVEGSICPPQVITSCFVNVFLCITREAAVNDIPEDSGQLSIDIQNLLSMQQLDQIREFLINSCFKLKNTLLEKRKNHLTRLSTQAMEYIKDNYSDPDLSTNSLCQNIAVSPSYLSSIFKKNYGKSVGAVIIQMRMEKAQQLILTTELKNYEIAEKSGYKDAYYFSYSFKKYFGISPNEMRKKILAEKTLQESDTHES